MREVHDEELAFSRTCRHVCRRCRAKRLAGWTKWRDTTPLAPVPHRQVVLTIPKRLRASCPYHRRLLRLLGDIARVAARTEDPAIRTLTGERELAVGIVACLQTHGSRASRHLDLHRLVTDGGFRPDVRLFVRLALVDADHAAVGHRADPDAREAVGLPYVAHVYGASRRRDGTRARACHRRQVQRIVR